MDRHGSTIIELLVVILIGTILAILAMPVVLQPREPVVRAPAAKGCAVGQQSPSNIANVLFNRLDSSGDGRITPEEWQECFQKLSQDRGYLTVNDLALLLAPRCHTVELNPVPEIVHDDMR